MKVITSLISVPEACLWATKFLQKEIYPSNITYLIQYGKINKYIEKGNTFIHIDELKNYYESSNYRKEREWKKKLGSDLNWVLSFDHLREKDTTKHVHRLHPYKGKFIPQLVEYFLNDHTDTFKTSSFFKPGNTILDPFCGSGTTLVQAHEMNIHSIGIDVSHFNCALSEVKLLDYNIAHLINELTSINTALQFFENDKNIKDFETELNDELNDFNRKHFPSPEYKRNLYEKKINEEHYGETKANEFLNTFLKLVKKYNISTKQPKHVKFIDKWYVQNIRDEINHVYEKIKKQRTPANQKLLSIILSRTIRSCRATTHSDLATLSEPQLTTYYCFKHKKICKPLFSIKYWFNRYAKDTITRLQEFSGLKTAAYWSVLNGDSREIDIFTEIKKHSMCFYKLLKKNKINGIFSSPPYVGQIDYHEQHAYAYDLLDLERKDDLEIGPLSMGKGKKARKSYTEGIAKVLLNASKYLATNYDVFLVANDRWGLYPEIASLAKMKIVDQFKRPVLNRTEKDKNPYSEIIFHLKEL